MAAAHPGLTDPQDELLPLIITEVFSFMHEPIENKGVLCSVSMLNTDKQTVLAYRGL